MEIDIGERKKKRHGSRHGITRREYLVRASDFAAKGERLPHSKLTPDIVRRIRDTAGQLTARQWADRLGVHVRTIDGVRQFRTWNHI